MAVLANNAYSQYANNKILTASPAELTLMLYEGAIKFCNIAEYNQRSAQEKWRRDGMDIHRIYDLLKKQSDERYFFYQLCLKMHEVVEFKGLRMIMENPWHETNYTNYFWFKKVSLIDKDRTKRGDY